jgi:hypothetical protein
MLPRLGVVLAIQDGEDADPHEEREVERAIALARSRATEGMP